MNLQKYANINIDTIVKERFNLSTPHLLISGKPGAGTNLTTKNILSYIINSTDDDVILVDPNGDYWDFFDKIKNTEDVEYINLSTSNLSINPMDIISYEKEKYYEKADFLITFFSLLANRELSPQEKNILSKVCKITYNKQDNPLLKDFLSELKQYHTFEVRNLIFLLEDIINIDFFNNSTKLEQKRILYIRTDNFSSHLEKAINLILMEYIFSCLKRNSLKEKRTSVFLPHIMQIPNCLFENITNKKIEKNLNVGKDSCYANYLSYIMKCSRKLGGSFIFSEFFIEESFKNFKSIFINISSTILLKQSIEEKKFLKEIYCLNDEQINLLLNSNIKDALYLSNKDICYFKMGIGEIETVFK